MLNVEDKNTLPEIPESWNDEDLKIKRKDKKKMSLVSKLFIWSLLFFILAGAFTIYSFFNQSSSFSENRLIITTAGPNSITSGEDGEINISVSNNNKIPLNEAYLVVTYDSGENLTGGKNMINERVEIGDILANNTIAKTLNFRVFGAEGNIKEFETVLYYKVPNSKAEFNKSSNKISVILKSSPVTINIESLKEIHKSYDLSFKISLKNNTNHEIKNLIISARNPNGFVYSSSTLPLFNNNPSWKINSLSANSILELAMTGKVTGDVGERLVFTFYTGMSNEDLRKNQDIKELPLSNFDNYSLNIDNIYSKVERAISITGQYLETYISNQDIASSNTLTPGEILVLELSYKNLTGYRLDNLRFHAQLLGDSIDKNNVRITEGYFDPNTMSLLWSKDTSSALNQVGAYAGGKLYLTFRVNSNAMSGSEIRLVISSEADRNSEDNVSNSQDVSLDKIWKVVPLN